MSTWSMGLRSIAFAINGSKSALTISRILNDLSQCDLESLDLKIVAFGEHQARYYDSE